MLVKLLTKRGCKSVFSEISVNLRVFESLLLNEKSVMQRIIIPIIMQDAQILGKYFKNVFKKIFCK